MRLKMVCGAAALMVWFWQGSLCQLHGDEQTPVQTEPKWVQVLEERLPAYGHRNWIVVADSAYPSQSRAGIETITIDGDQLEVVKRLLDELAQCRHIQPKIYVDAELKLVDNRDAAGIDAYRKELDAILKNRPVHTLAHEQIIDKLDQAAAKFHVLILKTDLTIPYTSVFLEFECGYWDAEKEARLREAMKKNAARP